MLHLGEVQKNGKDGGIELQLLARQESEHCWAIINPPESISLPNASLWNEGLLVLVDISNNQEVLNIQSAKEWVLNFIQGYLTIGITPMFLQEEVTRTEQWRQDLTLQSQDLTRQRAELEARRENIQSLESDLKTQEQQLSERENNVKQREVDLEEKLRKYNLSCEHPDDLKDKDGE